MSLWPRYSQTQEHHKMKLFLLSAAFVSSANAAGCTMKAGDRAACQTICDNATECGAWTFDNKSQYCYLKNRHEWTKTQKRGFDSGYKNQGPRYEANVEYTGGDLTCGR